MILTKEQIKFVNEERKRLRAEIAREPKYGLFRLVAREEAITAIIQTHNIAARAEKEKG